MKTLIAVIFLSLSVLANELEITWAQNEINLKKGECKFSIVGFPDNPLAGYSWRLGYDESAFEVRDSYRQSDTGFEAQMLQLRSKNPAFGVGGYRNYYFTVKPTFCEKPNTRQLTLEFVYSRAWDVTTATARVITVNFKR